jgi:hypothetical protein
MKKIQKSNLEEKGDLRISIEITLGETHAKRSSRIRRPFDVVVFINAAFKRVAICVLRRTRRTQRVDFICHEAHFYIKKNGLSIILCEVCT